MVHGSKGYFLVKKNQKYFSLPSGGVRRNEDFKDVAFKILNKVSREYESSSSNFADINCVKGAQSST